MASRHTSPNAMPLDQADGLRRLFAQSQVRFVPVVSNPHMAFGGVMLERLCSGFAEMGCHTLVVDASESAPEPDDMSWVDLAACIETLSGEVSYLAARGLPLRFVDSRGSMSGLLDAIERVAPAADVVLVHASASELCRLFSNHDLLWRPRPLLLAEDHPLSVKHAYAGMKLLTQRAGLMVHDLMLGAAPQSPRAERIAIQLATCADDFLGAVLHDWIQVDPASDPRSAPTPALRRWVRETLQPTAGHQVDRQPAPIELRAPAFN